MPHQGTYSAGNLPQIKLDSVKCALYRSLISPASLQGWDTGAGTGRETTRTAENTMQNNIIISA